MMWARLLVALLILSPAAPALAMDAGPSTRWSLRPAPEQAPVSAPVPGAPFAWRCPRSTLGTMLHLGYGGSFLPGGGSLLALRGGLLCVYNRRGDPGAPALHLAPEVGYRMLLSGQRAAPVAGHLVSAGASIGYGMRWASISYGQRVLLGEDPGGLLLGVSHGAVVRLLYEILSFELSHEVLRTSSAWQHDLVGLASVNVIVPAMLLKAMR